MTKLNLRIICIASVAGLLVSGCSNIFDNPGPNEFLVEESRSLAIPPDFDLRPPSEAARNDVPGDEELPGTEVAPTDLEVASRDVEGATAEDPEDLQKKLEEEKKTKKTGKSGFRWLVDKIF